MVKELNISDKMDYSPNFESQFLNEKTADVHFTLFENGNKMKIAAHKVILAVYSLPLEFQFNNYPDGKEIQLTEPSSTEAAVKEFLYTLYSKRANEQFTIENASGVLMLGRQFGVAHTIDLFEQFLMHKLTLEQFCLGFNLAIKFELSNLKVYCLKEIKNNAPDSLKHSFYDLECDVLEDLFINFNAQNLNETYILWDSCIEWAKYECKRRSYDPNDMMKWREVLGGCFQRIFTLILNNYDAIEHLMPYMEMFTNDEQTELLRNSIKSHSETIPMDSKSFDTSDEFFRFRDTMLATQICLIDNKIIKLQSTNKILLTGIAFSTMLSQPNGDLTVTMKTIDTENILHQQTIQTINCMEKPRNFLKLNILIEANVTYFINVNIKNQTVYYKTRYISNVFHGDCGKISVENHIGDDIFSHFYFDKLKL